MKWYFLALLLLVSPEFSLLKEYSGVCTDGTCDETGEQKDEGSVTNCPYPPPNLGDFEVHLSVSVDALVGEEAGVRRGGVWWPAECTARQTVAVIVPYRDRLDDLLVFLPNIHRFLKHQLLNYTVFLVEQLDKKHFNRAALLNNGFTQARRAADYDCAVFHDVDKFPEDTRNLYMCADQPTHLITKQRYLRHNDYRKRPYEDYFGGVTAITSEQFLLVNGFSNVFWGWGSEDDDFLERVKYHGLKTNRVAEEVGRYREIWHPYGFVNPRRHEVKKEGKARFLTDGLNSLHYKLVASRKEPLYTYLGVELLHDDPYQENK